MANRIFLMIPGLRVRRCKLPHPDAPSVSAPGLCPGCQCRTLVVHGVNSRRTDDDRGYVGDAVAECCGRTIGQLRVYVDTIFGVSADRELYEYARAKGIRIY